MPPIFKSSYDLSSLLVDAIQFENWLWFEHYTTFKSLNTFAKLITFGLHQYIHHYYLWCQFSKPCWWYWRCWVNCVLDNPHRECSIDLVAEAESWWLKYEKKRGDWWNQNGAQREVLQPSLGGLYPQPPSRATRGVYRYAREGDAVWVYVKVTPLVFIISESFVKEVILLQVNMWGLHKYLKQWLGR